MRSFVTFFFNKPETLQQKAACGRVTAKDQSLFRYTVNTAITTLHLCFMPLIKYIFTENKSFEIS